MTCSVPADGGALSVADAVARPGQFAGCERHVIPCAAGCVLHPMARASNQQNRTERGHDPDGKKHRQGVHPDSPKAG